MFQRHKSTGITNTLGIGRPINRYLISGKGGDLSPLHIIQTGYAGSSELLPNGNSALFRQN